jgi:hypothetical protein
MDDAASQSDTHVSLFRWLCGPASWSAPQWLGLLALLCVGTAAVAAGVSPFVADALAVAAYGSLAALGLWLFWRRFFSHE